MCESRKEGKTYSGVGFLRSLRGVSSYPVSLPFNAFDAFGSGEVFWHLPICSSCEMAVVFGKFFPKEKPLLVFLGGGRGEKLFSSSSLYGKIRMCLSHNRFGGVRTLHGKVTGITAHEPCIYLSFSTFGYLYHLVLFHEMITGVYTALVAGSPSLAHRYEEIPIFRVAKCFGKVTRRPPFYPILVGYLNTFKNCTSFLTDIVTHKNIKLPAASDTTIWRSASSTAGSMKSGLICGSANNHSTNLAKMSEICRIPRSEHFRDVVKMLR